MKHGTRITEVISDIQAIEFLGANMSAIHTSLTIISDGTTNFIPNSALPIFRSHLMTAADIAMVELLAEYERLVKESLER